MSPIDVTGESSSPAPGEGVRHDHGAVLIGIDLGGTKCLGIALAPDGTPLGEKLIPAPRTPTELLTAVPELVRALAGSSSIASVGIGVPGLVDRSGVLQVAPNLPALVAIDLQGELRSRLELPIQVENDATCAAWGEHQLGAARGLNDVVVLTLGTGIGGGIITQGSLYRGANGFAGEVGHMVIDPDGPRCGCGRHGCWETLASGNGLGRLARQEASAGRARRITELAGGDIQVIRGEHVTEAVAEGDSEAVEILGRVATWIALGLANLTNLLDPEALVVTGGLANVGRVLLDRVTDSFDSVMQWDTRPRVPILPATLGERAGAIGAARLGLLTPADSEQRIVVQ